MLKDDNYQPPNAGELFKHLQGATVFSRVDARDGFGGCPVRPSDRPLTAFNTKWGLYEWNVAPMGIKTSPAHFQRLMDSVLREHIGKWVLVFVDDILIFECSVDAMLDRIDQLHSILAEHRIHLKDSKCAFCLRNVKFLGNLVTSDGIHPDRSKLEALLHMPRPRQLRDVRALLGMATFLRQFIPQIATVAAPLYALTRKGQAFRWGDVEQAAYEDLMERLTQAPVLALPRADRPKALMTDASNFALGMALLQQEPDGKWHPIAFHSQRMTPMQARQSPTAKEFYAVVEALDHELPRGRLPVFSDHKPLEALSKAGHLNDLMMRRLDKIQAHGVDLHYTPAAEVGLCDWLSRSPDDRAAIAKAQALQPVHPVLARLHAVSTDVRRNPSRHARGRQLTYGTAAPAQPTPSAPSPSQPPVLPPPVTSFLKEIRNAQAACPQVKAILAQDQRDNTWQQRYRVHAGLLWHVHAGHLQLFIPPVPTLHAQLIKEAHDTTYAAHAGPKKTLARLRRFAHWPGMHTAVQRFCRTCPQCQATKPGPHARQGLRTPLPIPCRKWSWVSLDFVTGLPRPPNSSNDAVLAVVDKLTKRTLLIPCRKSITSLETAQLYYQWVWRNHGFPLRLVSDRGPQFASAVWRALWRLTGTTLNLTTADHPQTDGQSEKAIDIMQRMLRTFVNEAGDDWELFLPSLEFAYNDSVPNHGYTPFELEYGQHPSTPLALALGMEHHAPTLLNADPDNFIDRMTQSILTARATLAKLYQQTSSAENQSRRVVTFAPGDLVWVRLQARNRPHKLAPLWEGPYPVLSARGNVVKIDRPGRKHDTVNVDKLKLHQPRPSDQAAIQAHRFFTDTDGVIELQIQVGGVFHSLDYLLTNTDRADELDLYCIAHVDAADKPQHVGQRVRCTYVEGGRRSTLTGRVVYYDPNAQPNHWAVQYTNGQYSAYNADHIRELRI